MKNTITIENQFKLDTLLADCEVRYKLNKISLMEFNLQLRLIETISYQLKQLN